MLYLSGSLVHVSHPSLGWMLTPRMGQVPPDGGYFALDNGCFSDPDGFSMDVYERFVARLMRDYPGRCLFATAPDVPFDADGTLARFDEYRARMKAIGCPVALITQDGMGTEDVPWQDIDALFVGGTTKWKLDQESAALVREAHRRGLWVHVGRINSWRKFDAARSLGADSADGTLLKHGFDYNWPRLLQWLDNPQAVFGMP